MYKEQTFSFKIGNEEMEIKMIDNSGVWSSKVLKGDSGCGNCYGGIYNSFDEYKAELIKEHTYIYNFFNKGYKYAKENI